MELWWGISNLVLLFVSNIMTLHTQTLFKYDCTTIPMAQTSIQLGKNGVTENFIASLNNQFKYHYQVRIRVIKNAGENEVRDKNKVQELSDEILAKLNAEGINYSAKILGFTIIINKWKKDRE